MRIRDRALARDDRGAIMVLGIFMCTCLVGVLWYLAGIGDAILMRERAQEAADAIAFSDAALHARGMNLLVMINLVMACILGIRVALKVAQLVLSIAAAVFTGLGFACPAFWALVGPCMAGVEALESAINTTRTPINLALQGLTYSSDAVATTTPTASRTGSLLMIGSKYEPVVRSVGVAQFGDNSSLPVTGGSQDKLCKEAGRTVGYLGNWVLSKVGLGSDENDSKETSSWLSDTFAFIASQSPRHFCEMGSSTATNMDLGSLYDKAAHDKCDASDDKAKDALTKAEDQWLTKCAAYGVTCTSADDKKATLDHGDQKGATTPERQADLDRLLLTRDQEARAYKEQAEKKFGGDKAACQSWAKSDMQRRQNEQSQLQEKLSSKSASGASTSGVAPKKINDKFQNGHHDGQVAGGALIAEGRGLRSVRLVRVGAWNKGAQVQNPEGASLPSWAQAEFFFDCKGAWESCNDDEDAMWRLRWRARLRRWNEPESLDRAFAEMGFVGSVGRVDIQGFANDATSTPGLFTPNPSLRADLDRALRITRDRGVH